MDFSARFTYIKNLEAKLRRPAFVIHVFNDTRMQGDKGVVATIDLPEGNVIDIFHNHFTIIPIIAVLLLTDISLILNYSFL